MTRRKGQVRRGMDLTEMGLSLSTLAFALAAIVVFAPVHDALAMPLQPIPDVTSQAGAPEHCAFTWSVVGPCGDGGFHPINALLPVEDGPDGRGLYVAGNGSTLSSCPGGDVFHWTGSAWSSLGFISATTSEVFSLANFGGQIYAGGILSINHGVARWDGSDWEYVGSGLGSIHALAVFQNQLYAGGHLRIAQWDGSDWIVLGIPDGVVYAITVYNGALYIGGSFKHVGSTAGEGLEVYGVARWDGRAWNTLGDRPGVHGPADTTGTVYSMHVYEDSLYVGGEFTLAGGVEVSNVARWDGAWHDVGGGVDSFVHYDKVFALEVHRGELFAGGKFQTAGGSEAGDIASWDGEQWNRYCSVGINSDGLGGNPIKALAEFDEDGAGGSTPSLFAAGSFKWMGGERIERVARLSPTPRQLPFQDGFSEGRLVCNRWPLVTGPVNVVIDGPYPSGHVLQLRGGESVESVCINLEGQSDIVLEYTWARSQTGNEDSLTFSYRTSGGSLLPIFVHSGGLPNSTEFIQQQHVLPPDALHEGFTLHIAATNDLADEWYVDNVVIRAAQPGEPGEPQLNSTLIAMEDWNPPNSGLDEPFPDLIGGGLAINNQRRVYFGVQSGTGPIYQYEIPNAAYAYKVQVGDDAPPVSYTEPYSCDLLYVCDGVFAYLRFEDVSDSGEVLFRGGNDDDEPDCLNTGYYVSSDSDIVPVAWVGGPTCAADGSELLILEVGEVRARMSASSNPVYVCAMWTNTCAGDPVTSDGWIINEGLDPCLVEDIKASEEAILSLARRGAYEDRTPYVVATQSGTHIMIDGSVLLSQDTPVDLSSYDLPRATVSVDPSAGFSVIDVGMLCGNEPVVVFYGQIDYPGSPSGDFPYSGLFWIPADGGPVTPLVLNGQDISSPGTTDYRIFLNAPKPVIGAIGSQRPVVLFNATVGQDPIFDFYQALCVVDAGSGAIHIVARQDDPLPPPFEENQISGFQYLEYDINLKGEIVFQARTNAPLGVPEGVTRHAIVLVTAGDLFGPGAESCSFSCDSDLSGDGVIDAIDFAALLGAWGPCVGCPEDLTGDGVVDASDLAVLLNDWGPCEQLCEAGGFCRSGFYCRTDPGDCNGKGLCSPRPGTCTQYYDPVCGCDGVTYSNPCFAAGNGASIDHYGPCP